MRRNGINEIRSIVEGVARNLRRGLITEQDACTAIGQCTGIPVSDPWEFFDVVVQAECEEDIFAWSAYNVDHVGMIVVFFDNSGEEIMKAAEAINFDTYKLLFKGQHAFIEGRECYCANLTLEV